MKGLKVFLFWFLSLTWGCIMTAIGLVAAFIMLVTKHKPQIFGPCIYFEVGKNWGGINLGPIFLVNKGCGVYTKSHEAGHGIQNIILGPLFPFIVGIPSAMRYTVFGLNTEFKKIMFTLFVFLIALVIATIITFIALIVNVYSLSFLAIFISVYFLIIFLWLLNYEIPNLATAKYSDIWFEAEADVLGKRYRDQYYANR